MTRPRSLVASVQGPELWADILFNRDTGRWDLRIMHRGVTVEEPGDFSDWQGVVGVARLKVRDRRGVDRHCKTLHQGT